MGGVRIAWLLGGVYGLLKSQERHPIKHSSEVPVVSPYLFLREPRTAGVVEVSIARGGVLAVASVAGVVPRRLLVNEYELLSMDKRCYDNATRLPRGTASKKACRQLLFAKCLDGCSDDGQPVLCSGGAAAK